MSQGKSQSKAAYGAKTRSGRGLQARYPCVVRLLGRGAS